MFTPSSSSSSWVQHKHVDVLGCGRTQDEDTLTNLFGCLQQTPQVLVGLLQPSLVQNPGLGAELDHLLPGQALPGQQLPSLLSLHLETRTNAALVQPRPLTCRTELSDPELSGADDLISLRQTHLRTGEELTFRSKCCSLSSSFLLTMEKERRAPVRRGGDMAAHWSPRDLFLEEEKCWTHSRVWNIWTRDFRWRDIPNTESWLLRCVICLSDGVKLSS